jgi:hypothetical protein
MPTVTRCKESGELIVNGRLGLVTAWLRWLQPWVITACILPAIFWGFQHYYVHEALEEFSGRGNRVYSSSGEDISTDQFKIQLIAEVREIIRSEVPSGDVTRRLDALEEGVAANHAVLLRILERE